MSHLSGGAGELTVEHITASWCPSILGEQHNFFELWEWGLQPHQKYRVHHGVWRTWLFIHTVAYSDWRWLYYQFSLHHCMFKLLLKRIIIYHVLHGLVILIIILSLLQKTTPSYRMTGWPLLTVKQCILPDRIILNLWHWKSQIYLKYHHCMIIISSIVVDGYRLQLHPCFFSSEEKRKSVDDILSVYVGTHNFHNFTSGK